MKKVIGLCLVLLISSVSVFAQDGKRGAKKGGDPAQRCEKMIADLSSEKRWERKENRPIWIVGKCAKR